MKFKTTDMHHPGKLLARGLLMLTLCLGFSAQTLTAQHLTKTVIKYRSEGKWKESRQELNAYDSRDRISETIYQSKKDCTWVNQTKMTFAYDTSSGLEKERIYYQWKNDRWVANLRFRAERDHENRLIQENIDQFKNGEWTLSRKNATGYWPGSNVKSVQTYFDPKEDQWTENYQDRYLFEDQKLIEKTGYKMKSGTWQKSLLTRYGYDDQGNRITETLNRVTQDGILEWRKTSFTYSNGLKDKALVTVNKNGQWHESERHVYHYQQ